MQVGDNVQFLFEGSWYSGVYVGDDGPKMLVGYTTPLPISFEEPIKVWRVTFGEEEEKIIKMFLEYVTEEDYGVIMPRDEVKPDKNQTILKRLKI